jgi:hypothetical protein
MIRTALIVGMVSFASAAGLQAQRGGTTVVPACPLLTTAEAAAVLKVAATVAHNARDSVAEASVGKATCVYRPAKGFTDVVTVVTITGMAPQDGPGLARAVSDTAFGITAKPITGFPVAAALSTDPPTVALQKGSLRLLVSAPTVAASESLAAKALARLP